MYQRMMWCSQSGVTWPLVSGRPAWLNIRSHPEAWDSSPPGAVNPIWAAALRLESMYRVSWDEYSHSGSVSFGVWSSCAFVYNKLSCAPSNQTRVWWHVCPPHWEDSLQHVLITLWEIHPQWKAVSVWKVLFDPLMDSLCSYYLKIKIVIVV